MVRLLGDLISADCGDGMQSLARLLAYRRVGIFEQAAQRIQGVLAVRAQKYRARLPAHLGLRMGEQRQV